MDMFIHANLIKIREEKRLSRTDFMFELDKIGLRISPPTLYRWETGTAVPDANELYIIANFFKKPMEFFFTH